MTSWRWPDLYDLGFPAVMNQPKNTRDSKVPELASHLFSRIARRVRGDWMAKYGRPLYCQDIFVQRR